MTWGKKRRAWIGCTLGFLAVLMGEIYCLLNFRGDYIMAVGVGVVLLIMAYLMLDAAVDYWEIPDPEDFSDGNQIEIGDKERKVIRAELEKLRKELSDLLKAEIQYERENTKALISHNKKGTEELFKELQGLRGEVEHLSKILERKE